MIGGLGWPEAAILLLFGLFLFGPERLPTIAADAGRTLRKVRRYLKEMSEDLRHELPEVADLDLRALHPKEFVRRNLFEDHDEAEPSTLTGRRTALAEGEPAPWDPETT